jgi:hypothetical protein
MHGSPWNGATISSRRSPFLTVSEISYTPHRHVPMAGIAPA